jgi:hypothetical protein
MRREKIKSPDLADALMLAFAEYNPTLVGIPGKTATQIWSDDLEGPAPIETDPMYEKFVNDFYKMQEYPITEDTEREDGMVWN